MHTLVTLINLFEKQLDVSNLFLRICQEVIIHFREYREYDAMAMPLDAYFAENPTNHFAKFSTEEQTINYLRELAVKLVKRAVPKHDRSPLIISLVGEIVGSTVLSSVVNMITDPDWINQRIVAMAIESERNDESPAKTAFPPVLPLLSALEGVKDPTSSQFYIKIVEARRLPIKGNSGKLYAHVICGNETNRTKKLDPDSNPLFAADFTLYLSLT
jgi:hypothetical protein